MAAKQPMPGPGRFQWNTGGWFGGQIGGTAWMLTGALSCAGRSPAVAVFWVTCCAVANAAGIGLWRQRDRIPPFSALITLLMVCGASGLLAISSLYLIPIAAAEQQAVMRVLPRFALIVLVLFIFFSLQEWTGRGERAGTSAPQIELEMGEKLKAEVFANLFRGWKAVNGKLYVTDRRIRFESHRFSHQVGPEEIRMTDVSAVRPCNNLGLIPNGMEVETAQGASYRFVVWRRRRLVVLIQSQTAQLGKSANTLPEGHDGALGLWDRELDGGR